MLIRTKNYFLNLIHSIEHGDNIDILHVINNNDDY